MKKRSPAFVTGQRSAALFPFAAVRLLPVLLSLLLLLQLPCIAAAEDAVSADSAVRGGAGTVSIRSINDFLAFAEGCASDTYSEGKTFVLECDLDLTDTAFSPVPWFAGTFLGNGHRVTGLRFERDGSRQGLFRTVAEAASVRDLTVAGILEPGGTASFIGGIAGVNRGSIEDCRFEGTVSGIENIGGIVGHNEAAGTVRRCTFSGTVRAEHQSGGIAGKNDGVLSGCRNTGEVNTVAVTPAEQPVEALLNRSFDLSQLSQDDFVNLSNIGGIAGENTGIIEACRNNGPVGYRSTGYNVGGIAGKSSGFVTGSKNTADLNGRRDVGGIVGQLIPYSDWDLNSDRLDNLLRQITVLNSTVNSMTGNARVVSDSVYASLAELQSTVGDLTDALNNIVDVSLDNSFRILDSISIDPDTGCPVFTYPEFANADFAAFSDALWSLYAQSSVFLDLAVNASGMLASDLQRVGNQINNVFNAFMEAASGIGNLAPEVQDLSEAEAWTRSTGAVAGCMNTGSVTGEVNCGGVVGTAGFELEFDMEDRLDAASLLTGDTKHRLFAAVRGCSCAGEIEARSEAAGGIAGNMDLGVITGCTVTCSVSAGSGDRVGGLAGSTSGAVLDSWARCLLHGRRYVGGAAGLGGKISGCRVWAHFEQQSEYAGAVAGWTEDPVSGNLFVSVVPGGVDGVSLSGQSAALPEEEFLKLDGIPSEFGSVTVYYRMDGGTVSSESVPFGGTPAEVPAVENRDGRSWRWNFDPQERLFASLTVEGEYCSPKSTLASPEDPPRFLVEGQFYDGQELRVIPVPSQEQAEHVLPAWSVRVDGYSGELTVRMLTETEGTVLRIEEDGTLTPVSAERDGSYTVFRLPNGGSFCFTESTRQTSAQHLLKSPALLLLVGSSALVLMLIGAVLVLQRRRHPAEEVTPSGADSEKTSG